MEAGGRVRVPVVRVKVTQGRVPDVKLPVPSLVQRVRRKVIQALVKGGGK